MSSAHDNLLRRADSHLEFVSTIYNKEHLALIRDLRDALVAADAYVERLEDMAMDGGGDGQRCDACEKVFDVDDGEHGEDCWLCHSCAKEARATAHKPLEGEREYLPRMVATLRPEVPPPLKRPEDEGLGGASFPDDACSRVGFVGSDDARLPGDSPAGLMSNESALRASGRKGIVSAL